MSAPHAAGETTTARRPEQAGRGVVIEQRALTTPEAHDLMEEIRSSLTITGYSRAE